MLQPLDVSCVVFTAVLSNRVQLFRAYLRGDCVPTYTVRRQVFWDQWRLKLRESLAHLVGLIMRRAGGDASVALRVSFV